MAETKEQIRADLAEKFTEVFEHEILLARLLGFNTIEVTSFFELAVLKDGIKRNEIKSNSRGFNGYHA